MTVPAAIETVARPSGDDTYHGLFADRVETVDVDAELNLSWLICKHTAAELNTNTSSARVAQRSVDFAQIRKITFRSNTHGEWRED